jgi:hypothetical protein
MVKRVIKRRVVRRALVSSKLSFGDAFRYPFNSAKRMFNILWLLLPIFGWLALGGYGVRIVREFARGQFRELPEMRFGDDMKLGFFMFLKAIPFVIFCMLFFVIVFAFFDKILGMNVRLAAGSMDIIYPIIVCNFFEIFFLPILVINFMIKGTVGSFFEFRIVGAVFRNFWDYLLTLLKSIVLGVVFLFMWIVLVGIPAGTFTKSIFLADFYRRNVSR